jgi:hypothetical protein
MCLSCPRFTADAEGAWPQALTNPHPCLRSLARLIQSNLEPTRASDLRVRLPTPRPDFSAAIVGMFMWLMRLIVENVARSGPG